MIEKFIFSGIKLLSVIFLLVYGMCSDGYAEQRIITSISLEDFEILEAPTDAWYSNPGHIYLEQSIRQLQEVFEEHDAQQHMNYTIANLCFAYRHYLFVVYEKYLRSLEEHERPAAEQAMRNWLAFKDKKTSKVYNEYAGGTFAPLAGGQTEVDLTKAMINYLERNTVDEK